ncbi:FG-GAP repeat protein [Grimontia kaedaensis]|uniref:FG-GAP repeat protein n=1 Tax=Grimontia kaedaensis TaxID=2872157 RepID=A0ABY4WT24_9GAMM|nr:FG-GAP repeat protein [Grimontia kaedaensis]USH01744.1 FG-GAP repeat protein [Grimontia kaedaensis]
MRLTILIRPRFFLATFLFMLLRVGALLTVFVLTGCPFLVLLDSDDSAVSDSDVSVLEAFNLVSVSSGNTSSPDANVGRALFLWEVATKDTSTSVTYTVCQKDTTQPQNCSPLISVNNEFSSYVDVGGALKAADNVYFVLAQAGSEYLASNELSLESDVINQLIGYFKASNAGENDIYGVAVALSDDGGTLAVGAKQEDSNWSGINGDESNNSSSNSGAVYLYRKSNSTWIKEAYIKPNVVNNEDEFGRAIALSSDGNTLVVTAPNEDSNASGVNGDDTNNSRARSGAVYIFRFDSGYWVQEAYIKASAPRYQYFLGGGVSMSNDGNVVVVCSLGDDSNATGINGDDNATGSTNSGAMHVFRFSNGGWSQDAYIKASNTGAEDRFCSSVSVSGDGNTIAAGAKFEDSDATGIDGSQGDSGNDNGAAYVFRYSAGSWSQQAYIKASNSGNTDEFGHAVSLDDTGNMLAVSAPKEDSDGIGVNGTQSNNLSTNTGAVYLFRFDSGAWVQEAFIKLNSPANNDQLSNVNVSGDGNTLAIFSQDDSGSIGMNGEAIDSSQKNSGAVHLYQYRDSNWEYVHYLKSTNTENFDGFGASGISISQDGSSIAVGAQGEDATSININGNAGVNGASGSGAVYLF